MEVVGSVNPVHCVAPQVIEFDKFRYSPELAPDAQQLDLLLGI